MKIIKILVILSLLNSTIGFAQIKYFNTFTFINNGKGTDIKENVKLTIDKNYLSLASKTFNFNNAEKTGVNEVYNDSKKGDIIATQYKTKFYEIVLMRYLEFPNEIYLKVIDLIDNQNYMFHLHNE